MSQKGNDLFNNSLSGNSEIDFLKSGSTFKNSNLITTDPFRDEKYSFNKIQTENAFLNKFSEEKPENGQITFEQNFSKGQEKSPQKLLLNQKINAVFDASITLNICQNAKPDLIFSNSFPKRLIIDALNFNIGEIVESINIKPTKFNEQGHKILKYSSSPPFGLKFESISDNPLNVQKSSTSFKLNIRQKSISERPNTIENMDLNEDDLENFSENEYSLNNHSIEATDRPDKIRKLMEKQIKLSQQEEKFRKKLNLIKKSFETQSIEDEPSDRLNISVKELQTRSYKILENVRKSSALNKESILQKQVEKEDKKITKTPHEFELKFKNFVAENQSESIQNTSNIAQFESTNYTSVNSEIDSNFENVKSLNFFFNPNFSSNNFRKRDYLEYAGISTPVSTIRDSIENKSGLKDESFLILQKQENETKTEKGKMDFEQEVLTLTEAKLIDTYDKQQSDFSDRQRELSDKAFPYSEELSAESFDYFKKNGQTAHEKNVIDENMADLNLLNSKKPNYSDYHHYNPTYFQKHYSNIDEEMEEINMEKNQFEYEDRNENEFEGKLYENENSSFREDLVNIEMLQNKKSNRNLDKNYIISSSTSFLNEIGLENGKEKALGLKKTESNKVNSKTHIDISVQRYFSFTGNQ